MRQPSVYISVYAGFGVESPAAVGQIPQQQTIFVKIGEKFWGKFHKMVNLKVAKSTMSPNPDTLL